MRREGFRQRDVRDHLIEAVSQIRVPYRLVPEELDRVAVVPYAFPNLGAAGHGRAVGGNEVRGVEVKQLVESVDENARIPVLLASYREHVEQGRPEQVVHGDAQLGKPDRG